MEKNKYLNKAKVILENIYDTGYRCNYKTNYPEQCILEAMCQLAEEVELKTTRFCSYTGLDLLISQAKTMFTKEEVEELLQKQRELCYQKADYLINGTYCKEDGIEIDRDSILNAKLKIDE